MNQIRTDLRKIAAVTAVMSIAVLLVILWIEGVEPDVFLPALARGGSAISITAVFWVVYNKWLWRMKLLRLNRVPNLNGRWEGTVERTANDTPHRFVIEVQQDFTSFAFHTFSENSTGESISATITQSHDSNIFGVLAIWRTTTKKIGTPGEETFRGASHWRLELADRPGRQHDIARIVDDYHTERSTTGKVQVQWVSKKKYNSFVAPADSGISAERPIVKNREKRKNKEGKRRHEK